MNKELAITLLIVIIVVGGVFYLMGRDGTDSLTYDNDMTSEETQNTNQDTDDSGDNASVAAGDTGDTTDTSQGDSDSTDTTSTDTGDTSGDTGAGQSGDSGSGTTVTYTGDGFSPASVTIAAGESVTFVNESSRAFWPASAVHPTHSLYPEKTGNDCLGSAFDACEALQPGESYTFTFNSAGSWNYHDHLRANERGTVVVN